MTNTSNNKYSTVRKISIEFDELPRDEADKFLIHILNYRGSKNHQVILNRLEVNGGNIHEQH